MRRHRAPGSVGARAPRAACPDPGGSAPARSRQKLGSFGGRERWRPQRDAQLRLQIRALELQEEDRRSMALDLTRRLGQAVENVGSFGRRSHFRAWTNLLRDHLSPHGAAASSALLEAEGTELADRAQAPKPVRIPPRSARGTLRARRCGVYRSDTPGRRAFRTPGRSTPRCKATRRYRRLPRWRRCRADRTDAAAFGLEPPRRG